MSPDRAAYPNACVMLDPRVLNFGRPWRGMTAEQLGAVVLKMADDVQHGRWDEVAALSFTGRITKGVAHPSPRPGIPQAVRRDVLACGSCRACGSTRRLEVDHIVPWSRGGTHERSNLQALCKSCNRSKQARTMEEWLA